jgi:hypothetical protein
VTTDQISRRRRRWRAKKPYHRHRRLLRTCRERPRGCRAAESSHELTPSNTDGHFPRSQRDHALCNVGRVSRSNREVCESAKWLAVLLRLLRAAVGTDRRTGVCGTDRCYHASSRHQPACQARLPRLKMTHLGSGSASQQPPHMSSFSRNTVEMLLSQNLQRKATYLLGYSVSVDARQETDMPLVAFPV